ncbi:SdpI family protein [bacterium]|nr:SdpI family protein [bacterium]
MKLQKIITFALIISAYLVCWKVYGTLPETIPSHWNATGEVDGYVSRNMHFSLFLGLITVLPLLMQFIPKLDPKYKNIKTFEEDFGWFMVVLTGFILGLFLYINAYALGYTLPIQNFMIPALALLFFTIGYMLRRAKMNYSIGMLLPWTLNSEKNWDLTHRFASKTFMYGATILLLTLLLRKYAFTAFLLVLAIIVIAPIVYSYKLHKKGI